MCCFDVSFWVIWHVNCVLCSFGGLFVFKLFCFDVLCLDFA